MRFTIVLASCTALASIPAMAQNLPDQQRSDPTSTADPDANPHGVEEIIVTAQRRSQRSQDVPIAITAVSATRLASNGLSTAQDLGVVTPALTVASTQNYFQPRIRGVGTQAFGPGLENPIATYIDGIYIASAPASLLSLSGIDRVEVLKGPQGTLFGRNATGGLIQVVTRDPRGGFSGNADVSYGTFQAVTSNLYLTGGSDRVAADLAVRYGYQGQGYGRNFALNEDTNQPEHDFVARSKLMAKLGANTTIVFSGDYARSSGSYPTARQYALTKPLYGPQSPGGPWDADNDYATRNRFEGGGGSLRIDHDLGAVRIVSLTAYRKSKYAYQLDFDATRTPAFAIANIQHDEQFSQELQLASAPGSRVQWLAGAYYFYGKGSFDPAKIDFQGPVLSPTSPTFPVDLLEFQGGQTTKSFAGFAQATMPLGDRTNLTGGLRYTSEKRALDVVQTTYLLGNVAILNPFVASVSFNRPTWRVSLDHKITPDVMIYGSYNRGFKSGGYNVTTPLEAGYAPEKLDAYELGVKASLLDNAVRFNPSLFYYDYKNIQVQFYTNQGQIGIRNGPSARIYGLDIDFEIVPTRNLHLFGGVTWLHDRFGAYPDAPIAVPLPVGGNVFTTGDATGNRLPFTATFSGNIGAEYTIRLGSGDLALNANLSHNSGFYSETDNQLRQPSYDLVNASIGWTAPSGRLTMRLWGRNLTNEAVVTQLSSGPAGVGAAYQPPRTYGATLGTRF